MPQIQSTTAPSKQPAVALVYRRPAEQDLLQETAEQLREVWLAAFWIKLPARQVRWQTVISDLESHGARVIVAFGGSPDSDAAKLAERTEIPVLALPPIGRGRPLSRVIAAMQTSRDSAPVGTLALGKAGARNAALFAAAILASRDRLIAAALRDFREQQTSQVLASRLA